jgi:flagellum-specific peptidoglycan hydrolase FlgJ
MCPTLPSAGSDEAYFEALQADGYATDPNYAHALMDMLASVQSLEKHMTPSGAA